jgi:hypothetical protein
LYHRRPAQRCFTLFGVYGIVKRIESSVILHRIYCNTGKYIHADQTAIARCYTDWAIPLVFIALLRVMSQNTGFWVAIGFTELL